MNQTTQTLIQYLNAGKNDNIISTYRSSDFTLILAEQRGKILSFSKEYIENKARYYRNYCALRQVASAFEHAGIAAIVFKGIPLSEQLYCNPMVRPVGDIDLYVSPDSFEQAYTLLKSIGYCLRSPDGEHNVHHISLVRNDMTLELHKKVIHPSVGIDESFLTSHTRTCLSFHGLATFSESGTFLHLLYHLYMDCTLICTHIYDVVVNQQYLTVPRFLFRAYEIALYVEKYQHAIKWKQVWNEMRNQRLRYVFIKMISDIMHIFCDSFPRHFENNVNRLMYVYQENDDLYQYLTKTGQLGNCVESYICKYIESRRKSKINIYLAHDSSGHVIRHSAAISMKSNEEKVAVVRTVHLSHSNNSLRIVVRFDEHKLCFSYDQSIDTMRNDGFHLILCSLNGYSYHSYFFFPRETSMGKRIYVYDFVHNQYIPDRMIKATWGQDSDNRDQIIIELCKPFLETYAMESDVYMGYLMPVYSEREGRRVSEISTSPILTEWYNPLYFYHVLY